ncbi:MAK10-like protein [Tanacetum coccineum]
MGDENSICTLGDYSKPSHEGYRNTIELPDGNNVVPLRSDTIWLVQNGFSFHRLRSEDPNEHLKDFLKLVDLLNLDVANRERTRLRLFQFSLRDQASNWLERLPARSISTWEDLTTRFLAQFFPPGRTAKLRNDILMFQQHYGESLFEAWTRFKDLLQKVPHYGIDLWLQVQIFYDHVNPVTRRTIDQSICGKLHDKNHKESWALLEDLALYDNESWNDPKDFAKLVKAISLPQDVPSTSDCHLIELENQVQRLMEDHLAPKQPIQVNKISSLCEICSGLHDTQYCMGNPKQAFVDYASLRTDEAGGKWYTFKPKQNNLGDTYNPSWKSHPNLMWKQPQNSQSKFSNPPNRFQPNSSFLNRSFNNNPQNFNNQSNLEGLAITDRITGALPSDTVKNPKLNVNSTSPVSSAHSYPTKDPHCSSQIHSSINAITIHSKQPNKSRNDQPQDHDTFAEECETSEEEGKEEKGDPENTNTNPPSSPDPSIPFITEKVRKLNSFLESFSLVPQSSDTKFVCTKEDDGDVMFIEIIKKYDDSREEDLEGDENIITGGLEAEYFDIFPTRSELAYHKYLMSGPIPSLFLRNPVIIGGCLSNPKITCNIGHVHVEKAYIDLNSPLNIMTQMLYN